MTGETAADPAARKPYTLVDLFAGAGGFSFGFTEEGFQVLAAVENFLTSAECYLRNVPADLVLQADVRNIVPGKDIPVEPDVLIGGPPCEEFTVANSDRRKDPLDRLYKTKMGSLTLQYIILLKQIRPRVFVMENVPGILDGPLKSELRMLFAKAGYRDIHFNVLEAEDYGTPSHRTRVFVSNIPIAPPKVGKHKTVWEAIGDLESLDVDLPNHVETPLRGKRGERMQQMGAGESMYHYRAADGNVHGVMTRLRKNELAPTVKGLGRFIHPTQDRLLTPREHARLMGYPDDYVFIGGKNDQYNAVGESVPPPLSQAIAGEVRRWLDAHPEA
ncbi:MAG TPA: DNA cytosine methyltransferase, partial [Candidatus Thermoplasmatota archaeon]|nr:DNA cytosine methyltransferase [Candidatus Thermoplasmatota archaeon]